MCSYADNGCAFEGNRSSVAAHEQQCDFVPRSVLRGKIEALNAVIAAKDKEIQETKKTAQRAVALVVENELKPTLDEQKALVLSALGPDPATSTLRVVYGLAPHREIFAVKRKDASGSNGHTTYFILKQKKLNFRVIESNYNVALFITATGDDHSLEPYVFQQGSRFVTTLLHPHDVREAKVVSFDLMKVIADKEDSVPNFMSSSQIDKYCANGCFYFTVKYATLPPQAAAAAP
jgi:fructose-specific phosphotransferase system component IIB